MRIDNVKLEAVVYFRAFHYLKLNRHYNFVLPKVFYCIRQVGLQKAMCPNCNCNRNCNCNCNRSSVRPPPYLDMQISGIMVISVQCSTVLSKWSSSISYFQNFRRFILYGFYEQQPRRDRAGTSISCVYTVK